MQSEVKEGKASRQKECTYPRPLSELDAAIQLLKGKLLSRDAQYLCDAVYAD
jgi:hypothetical protein